MLDEGALFGELRLFDDGPRSADARALEETSVLVLGYEPVRAALDAHPELALGHRAPARPPPAPTDEALADAVFLDVPARTAKRLLELAGDADEFRLPVTQEELAGMVGASRERVEQGAVAVRPPRWLEVRGAQPLPILDREALEDRATL